MESVASRTLSAFNEAFFMSVFRHGDAQLQAPRSTTSRLIPAVTDGTVDFSLGLGEWNFVDAVWSIRTAAIKIGRSCQGPGWAKLGWSMRPR